MTIHSIIPEETIFEGYDTFQPQYMELSLNGISMQVEMVEGGQARIVRLLSCDANDYLNPAYAPGNLLEFQPILK
ncbi:YlzJ-like family protein [Gorillibacterium sp. sgz5001074]|uniref:YlzJ-like family protein n=1 Tax=Gorillibacterium sp. sgz5001074 TaxID=3446695 RepID=UPI003F67C8B2